jgi:Pyruvate/2-oxoacid:ferredoxin oxidoreductase gamma subunit
VLFECRDIAPQAGESLRAREGKDEMYRFNELNVAMLGILSAHLDLAEEDWMFGLERNLPEKVHARNKQVYALGREVGGKMAKG